MVNELARSNAYYAAWALAEDDPDAPRAVSLAKAACAELGDTAFEQLGKSALATDFASYAADCLDSYSDIDTRQKLRRRLRTRLERLVGDAQAELLADDRSDGYGTRNERRFTQATAVRRAG